MNRPTDTILAAAVDATNFLCWAQSTKRWLRRAGDARQDGDMAACRACLLNARECASMARVNLALLAERGAGAT